MNELCESFQLTMQLPKPHIVDSPNCCDIKERSFNTEQTHLKKSTRQVHVLNDDVPFNFF